MCIANPACKNPVEAAIAAVFAPRDNAPPQDAGHRRKLWEIRAAYHCPIIGTCLSVEELRNLARRTGVDGWQSATDYELHSIAVGLARERSDFAQLLHKTLDRKFDAVLRQFARAADEDAVLAMWRAALARGEPAGALWAALSHGKVTERVAHPVYEDIHMLSHQVGAASRADLRELARFKAANADLEERLARQRRSHAEQLAEKDRHIARLEATRRETHQPFVPAPNGAGNLAQELAAARQTADLADKRCREAEAQKTEYLQLMNDMMAERDAAEAALHSLLPQTACESCVEGQAGRCAGADFAGRCVLCVGGRSGLADHYRTLVESSNGRFVHHDGGVEDNPKRLQALLCSADAVICPADNVSHAAYYLVKRLCKQHGKPCVLLKRSGLSTFARGLAELAEGGTYEG